MRKLLLGSALGLSLMALQAPAALAGDAVLQRFFGDCTDVYATETDLDKAVGECGIIQVMTNAFNAQYEGESKIETRSVAWGSHYDQLSASIAGSDAPTIAVMHADRVVNYVRRGLLEPLGKDFAEVGVDVDDLVKTAAANASSEGEYYALPFDIHGLLWHANKGLMKEAGLVDADGEVMIPSSQEEFFAHAKKFKEATGQDYLAIDKGSQTVWLFYSLIWQQGGEPISPDGKMAQLTSPEAKAAANFLKRMFSEGYANPTMKYADAQKAFLNNKVGVLLNGTWVVDFYRDQAEQDEAPLTEYEAHSVPAMMGEPAVWVNSHMWVMPKGGAKTEEEKKAAIAFLKFIYDNNGVWARTGHLPVRTSVLDGDDYNSLPMRKNIRKTAEISRSLSTNILNLGGIQDVVQEEHSRLATNDGSVEEILEDANRRANRLLRRNNR